MAHQSARRQTDHFLAANTTDEKKCHQNQADGESPSHERKEQRPNRVPSVGAGLVQLRAGWRRQSEAKDLAHQIGIDNQFAAQKAIGRVSHQCGVYVVTLCGLFEVSHGFEELVEVWNLQMITYLLPKTTHGKIIRKETFHDYNGVVIVQISCRSSTQRQTTNSATTSAAKPRNIAARKPLFSSNHTAVGSVMPRVKVPASPPNRQNRGPTAWTLFAHERDNAHKGKLECNGNQGQSNH